MNLQKLFATNPEKDKSGFWYELDANDDKTICQFKLAGMSSSNPAYVKESAKLQKQNRFKKLTPEKDLELSRELFVNAVLVDWKHVKDFREGAEPNSEIPYTKENALWLMQTLPNLFTLLVAQASDITNFQDEQKEDAGKK